MSRRRTIEIHRDRRGKWRWRERSPNGRITAEGGQGYSRQEHARRAWDRHEEMILTTEHRIEVIDGSTQA